MKSTFNVGANGAGAPEGVVIFLDLDGVIADFDTHLHAQGKVDGSGKTKWNELDHEWFSTIPVYEGARDFYFKLKDMAAVKFLTAPTMSTGSISGKADWIQNSFLPKRGKWALMDFIIAPSKDKQFLAGPTRILVDDRIKNIQEWEEAGGIGVHHQGDFAATLAAVKKAINDMNDDRKPAANENVPAPR